MAIIEKCVVLYCHNQSQYERIVFFYLYAYISSDDNEILRSTSTINATLLYRSDKLVHIHLLSSTSSDHSQPLLLEMCHSTEI